MQNVDIIKKTLTKTIVITKYLQSVINYYIILVFIYETFMLPREPSPI